MMRTDPNVEAIEVRTKIFFTAALIQLLFNAYLNGKDPSGGFFFIANEPLARTATGPSICLWLLISSSLSFR
jgi:hypothetical protein